MQILERIYKIVENTRKYLPLQAPLSNFIHNNTLMSFENMSFEEATKLASSFYNAQTFKEESYYLNCYSSGRITNDDLKSEIFLYLSKNNSILNQIFPAEFVENFHLYLLKAPVETRTESSINWKLLKDRSFFITSNNIYDRSKTSLYESWIYLKGKSPIKRKEIINYSIQNSIFESLRDHIQFDFSKSELDFEDEAKLSLVYYGLCLEHLKNLKTNYLPKTAKKHGLSEFWENEFGEDFNKCIHPIIIKLSSNYCDQGISFWPSPYHNESIFNFFRDYFIQNRSINPTWQKIAADIFEKYSISNQDQKSEFIEKCLLEMGVGSNELETYLIEILFDLKGWTGMIDKLERFPDQAPVKSPSIKLLEFLISRILIEYSRHSHLLKKHNVKDFSKLHKERLSNIKFQDSLITTGDFLYQLLSKNGKSIEFLINTDRDRIDLLFEAGTQFNKQIRLNIWHNAFEKNFINKALSSIYHHINNQKKYPQSQKQFLFCMDDREESIRRYVEDQSEYYETFGVLGFFGLDMEFQSLKHPKPIIQCPPVVKPSKKIREITRDRKKDVNSNKENFLLAKISMLFYYQSRTLLSSIFISTFFGVFSIFPLMLKSLFPSIFFTITNYFNNLSIFNKKSTIQINREDDQWGYTKEEQAERVETILKMGGLTKHFCKLIPVIGHGSSSNNNPFRNAYGCGACSGRPGGPNARSFAKMANDPVVRDLIKKNGIEIPSSTFFLPALHDTANDNITFYDLDDLPNSHNVELQEIRKILNIASSRNSWERTRKYESINFPLNAKRAQSFALERSISLAEPRPEFGHNLVSLCIVGRRELTRNFFMDRRSFLISYDHTIDSDAKILSGLLGATLPVCVNISLDYFFSNIDNESFGAGTKLPLNVTSLLGVMTGSSSDLRIGLARQMVEIHEPIRITILVETTNEILFSIINSSTKLSNLFNNSWGFIGTIDPKSRNISLYKDKKFIPFNPVEGIHRMESFESYIGNDRSPLPFASKL